MEWEIKSKIARNRRDKKVKNCGNISSNESFCSDFKKYYLDNGTGFIYFFWFYLPPKWILNKTSQDVFKEVFKCCTCLGIAAILCKVSPFSGALHNWLKGCKHNPRVLKGEK